MCEPTTIIMATTAAVGAGVSIYSQVKGGSQRQQIEQNNAALARQQMAYGLQRGEAIASAIRAQGARQTASAAAQMVGSGVDITSGSPAGLLAQSQANAAADAEMARANAAMEAWGLKTEIQSREAQGSIARSESILGATATGISAAGSIGSMTAKSLLKNP